jgi:hypothetical protein
MKNIILLISFFLFISPAIAENKNKSVTKIYDKYGSYQGKYIQDSKGSIRHYGKYGSLEGVIKPVVGSRMKYYKR